MVSVYSLSCRKRCRGEEGGNGGWRGGGVESWRRLRRFRNNEKQMTMFFQLRSLWACVSVFSQNFIANTFGWPKLYFGNDGSSTQRFSSLQSDLFFRAFPSLIHPSVHPSSSLARPSSGLHRGERVWDGVAEGLTGKQRFSPASITSSQLSRVEPSCYETISWQAVFSLAHWIEARSHSL